MKKLAVLLIFFILLAGVGLYLASGAILATLSDRMIDYVTLNVRLPNLEYTRPVYGGVRLSSWKTVTWTDVQLNARLVRNQAFQTSEDISLRIGDITLGIENFAERTILLSVEGFTALAKEQGPGANLSGPGDRMEGRYLQIQLQLPGFGMPDILAQLGTLKEELQRFSVLGVTRIPMSFSATETFAMQGRKCTVKLFVDKKGEEYRLVMDKDDLTKVAALLTGQKPNPVDLAVIARNPLKAAQLLRIRDKAATTAQLAAQQNPKIPEDAYRHTLWSYLLTKMYGEQFAREVTNAHEAYADEEELRKADRISWLRASYQDLVNNALGRQYAALGYPEAGILERVLTDPAIIRDNEAVKRFNALEYEKLKPAHLKPE